MAEEIFRKRLGTLREQKLARNLLWFTKPSQISSEEMEKFTKETGCDVRTSDQGMEIPRVASIELCNSLQTAVTPAHDYQYTSAGYDRDGFRIV